MTAAAFHAREGWFWRRNSDASVTVYVEGGSELTLDAWSWASVVASVSERGEDGPRFREALAFHGDTAVPATGASNR